MGCNVVYGSVLLLIEDEVIPERVSVPDELAVEDVLLDDVVLEDSVLPVPVVLQVWEHDTTGVSVRLAGGVGPTPTQ
jgi:hypothetical protein